MPDKSHKLNALGKQLSDKLKIKKKKKKKKTKPGAVDHNVRKSVQKRNKKYQDLLLKISK